MIVIKQIVSKDTVAHAIAVDPRASADAVLKNDVLFNYRKRDDAIAWSLCAVAIHVNTGGVVVMRSVASYCWEVAAVTVIDAVLAVECRFVVLNQGMIAEREKYSRKRGAVGIAILNGDEISYSNVETITRRVCRFEPVDNPIAYDVPEQLDFDVAVVPIRWTGSVHENACSAIGFQCARRSCLT